MHVRNMRYVAMCVVAAWYSAGAPAQESDPRIGVWAERKVSDSYEGLRRSFEDLGGGRTRVNITIGANSAALQSADHRCDGQQYPVLGPDRQPTGETLSCQIKDARTIEFTFTGDGMEEWMVSTGTERVSEDGQTYAVEAEQTDAEGRVVHRIERLFDRQ